MSVEVLPTRLRPPAMALRAGALAKSPLTWCLLATVLLSAATLGGSAPLPSQWLGDTDDAVRLVSVRDLIAGAPWFDTTLARIGAPEPLVSHWSRLIDLPIAVLIDALTPLLGGEAAELAARVAWPALLYLGLLVIVAREAEREGGRWAAAFAVLLAATSAIAFVQFRPGRIDHHNAQILCAVAGLLLLLRSLRQPAVGWVAGCLIGTGLAIGYEAIALVGPTLGMAAAAAVWRPADGAGVLRAAAATTMALAAALALTVPPWRLLDIHCDALSLDLLLLAASCTAGLWTAMALGRTRLVRFGIVGIAAAAGALIFAGLEPACLAGPFGQISPVLSAVWLDHVTETKSIFWLAAGHPAAALTAIAFPLAGAAAQLAAWYRRRDANAALAALSILLAGALGCWQLKLLPYASWLAVLPIAVFAARLRGTAAISAPIARLTAACLLSQATLDVALHAVIAPIFAAPGNSAAIAEASSLRQPCYLTQHVRALGALAPGLVAADIGLAPYIVALTPHRVVAAPYHRLEKSILLNHAILDGAPAQALHTLMALGVDYVALCNTPVPATSNPASLRARCLAGDAIAPLQEVATDAEGAIRVWRVGR